MSGLYVGVDGGQSTLRLTVAGSGVVHEAPGFSYPHPDPVSAIAETVAQAWAAANRPGPVARVALGLTGLPARPEQRDLLAGKIAATLRAEEVVLCADNVTAHAGALPGGHGVVLTIGTGVGCLAVDSATGTSNRVDGWGHLFGDDGSAFAIGRAGIAAVLRAHDGRGPRTALSGAALRRYGPVTRMPSLIYTSGAAVDVTARFAPDVVATAAGGDEVAARIVAAAGRELAGTAATAVRAVSGDAPVPVTQTGRLVEPGGLLAETFLAELAATVPRARPVPAAGTSLDGACRLATASDPAPYRSRLHIYRGL
ncbi:N-acetylglucosamine kinase [Nonomuraea jiangxiensis]|uniref:BadF-type ATPase n=1 Tax=Nonomuraea jiangxiensis TaxID=633440 RepID=A0A1G9JSK2_9ACTN|nr:BadF/BadG/BcrA/BcrD ATPase family protein [Nonomuraea jiangxiensis]SDL40600.1 BadF-type ATPase [Nonomuraea jiangxiensis]